MHRAGSFLSGQLHRGRRQSNGFAGVFGADHGWLVKPAHMGAKEFNLVNGLRSASALKFWRPVSGKNQEWHTAVKGFNNCRKVVGGRRARSANQGNRLFGGSC
jgi:hypothetical protein